jgi:hypothetical protein
MKLGVVAIPLFAAIWLATPVVGAQEPDPPRTARPKGSAPSAPRAPRAEAPPNRRPEASASPRANADDQRDRGNGRGRGRDGDGDRGGNGRVTPRGYTQVPRDDQRGPSTRGPIVINRDNDNNHRPTYYNNHRPGYYPPAYYDRWARNYYRWSPIRYAPWGLIYGSVGYSNFGFYGALGSPYPAVYGAPAYGYGYGGGYSPWVVSGYDFGGVRLKIRPRDAQVFVDGNYAGLVDDFDGSFQSLRLQQGGHKIEIHMPGFEDLELDVHVQPGKTITLDQDLRPRP